MTNYQDHLPDLLILLKETARIIKSKAVPLEVGDIRNLHEITCFVEEFRQDCLRFIETTSNTANTADIVSVKETVSKMNKWMESRRKTLDQDSVDISRGDNPYNF